ncbi:MAG: 2Fe-2S iron-sulfur cluster-binding protein, partial [Nitratireductor sp.]
MSGKSLSVSLEVNGKSIVTEVSPLQRLSSVLRDELGLTGTKVGCDAGDCGACSVTVDGAVVCACLVPAAGLSGKSVRTVEGLSNGSLSALQESFLRHGAAQCGICTPGVLVSAAALLEQNPTPSETEVQDALGGVLCRCTGYRKIIEAVMNANRSVGVDASMVEQGHAVGASPIRLDGERKVNGTEIFGADERPADALSVAVVRSPHWHADFEIGDTDAFIAAHPGIVAVFTAADIPGENRFGVIPPFADQPALAEGRARFRGEAVALIAGERDAIEALDMDAFPIRWQELPHALTPDEARREGFADLHEGRTGNKLTRGFVECGDPEGALSKAFVSVSGEIATSYVEHAYIEP